MPTTVPTSPVVSTGLRRAGEQRGSKEDGGQAGQDTLVCPHPRKVAASQRARPRAH